MPLVVEVVAPPDIEKAYVAHLKTAFAGRSETAWVGTKVPTQRPDRRVRVSLLPGTKHTRGHFYCRVLVECSAPTETAAGDLARLTYALTCALEGEDAASVFIADVVTVGSPANFPEPGVGPRYQFTADLLVDGEVI